MKKSILLLLVGLLSNGWLFANHWIPDDSQYEDNMTLTSVIQINGIEQQSTALEVGVFCGEECRGSEMPTFFPPTQRYVVQLTIFGEIGDQLTFKLYDHNLNQELNLASPDAVTFIANGYGSLQEPYVLNFTGSVTETFTITVSVDPTEGGTVTGAGNYEEGQTCTLVATANEGYAFSNWTEGGVEVSTNVSYAFTVTSDRNLVANFISSGTHWIPNESAYEDNMTLTGVIQINGVEQQSTTLEVGVFCGEECRGVGLPTYFFPTQRYVVQLTIFGENGDQLTFKLYDHDTSQELDLISPDAVTFIANGYGSLQEPYVLNFTGSATETYTISVSVNPTEGGTVTGAGNYEEGQTCTLVATTNEGYAFTNWTEGGVEVSTNASYAFTVTSDRNLVANFISSGTHWIPNESAYEDNMTLTGVIQINGVEQQSTTLEVGVFCGEECRGTGLPTYFFPTQRYVVQLTIFGVNGDQLTFKLFDHALNQELDLTSPDAVTFTTNGYGSLSEPYLLNFTGNGAGFSQTYNLVAGWNWVSTYIAADDPVELLDMFKAGLGDNATEIQSYGYATEYEGDEEWFGDLDEEGLENEQMYLINVINACSVTLEGMPAVPEEYEITINPGWNWIGFPSAEPIDVADALADFEAEEGDEIQSKDYATEFDGEEWFGDLETFTPGEGYMYFSASEETKILVFQTGRKAVLCPTSR